MSFTDTNRETAAKFIELAHEHITQIATSDLYTNNFIRALDYAGHMVKGGSYSGGERDVVFVQFRKLAKHFA